MPIETDFSNFGSLKSTETNERGGFAVVGYDDFSNFGSLKSTETPQFVEDAADQELFQQFRLVEEH